MLGHLRHSLLALIVPSLAAAGCGGSPMRPTPVRVPYLSVTRFLAFGDSLTDGTTSPDGRLMLHGAVEAYVFKLRQRLAERYRGQNIIVHDQGLAGEFVVGAGEKRFRTVVGEIRPEVVLLLDGANDLLNGQAQAVPGIITALRAMTAFAKSRGAQVMLATFPPQDPNGRRGAGALAVPALNAQITALAAAEEVTLVDLNHALGGSPAGAIGIDGLHPTDSGYDRIADAWLQAIVKRFERLP